MNDGLAGVPEIQYDYTVTSTATASGQLPSTSGRGAGGEGSGTWTQSTTNYAAIGYFMGVATETGHGQTTATYTWSQPYSSGSSSQPVNGTQYESNVYQDSYNYGTASSYSIPFSGGGSTGGGGQLPSPSGRGAGGEGGFALAGTSVAYSGGGTESTSGENTSSYSSTGNYTLAPDGAWQPVSGTGWSQGNSFSSSSYSGSGTYSYNLLTSPSGGTGGTSVGYVSGSFTESGESQSTQQYQTDSTLGPAGWLQTGWMWTDTSSESYQSASGSGSFALPAPTVGLGGGSLGFAYNGTTTEANGQSSNSDVTSDYALDADGGWQQTAGLGNNTSATWQSSSQEGEYSHAVNGVTLEGTFSQSASQSDNASYTTGGSPGLSGQWVPTGNGSETLATSSSNSYEGSSLPYAPTSGTSCATDFLAVGGSYDWPSTGTQYESESTSANASHTTEYSLQPMSASGKHLMDAVLRGLHHDFSKDVPVPPTVPQPLAVPSSIPSETGGWDEFIQPWTSPMPTSTWWWPS